MNAIVHGEIGVGKSTAVRAAMKRLGWASPAGFFTHWGGQGRGADVLYFETWSGEKHPMARRVAAPAIPAGPPYELDAERFAEMAVASLSCAASGQPVVIDELGLIELGAPEFAAAVAAAFRGPAPVLAVIQHRALARWLGLLDPPTAERRFRVDPATRDALPAQIAALFRA